MFNLTTKPVSAGELMKKEKKPINFVVEKFMSQGVHFLAGHPMKELLSVGNNLTQLTTRAKLMNLEVVDLKPTYMKLVEIYTVLTELLKRVKG